MTRYSIDCREYPHAIPCTMELSADSIDELVVAAAHHAVRVHAMEATPEFLEQLRGMCKAESPILKPKTD